MRISHPLYKLAAITISLCSCSGTVLLAAKFPEIEFNTQAEIQSGLCPNKVVFRGAITYDKPGLVEYRFIRSDGGQSKLMRIEFGESGRVAIETTWAFIKSTSGWIQVQISAPTSEASKKAQFSYTCK